MNAVEKIPEKIVYGVYSIFDEHLKVHNPPFFARTNIEALKVVRDDVKNIPDGILSINADIFSLVRIGFVDLMAGELIPDYDFVCRLIEFKDVKEV